MSNKEIDIHMSENLDDETGTILDSADSDDSKSKIPKEEKKEKKSDGVEWETNDEETPDDEW